MNNSNDSWSRCAKEFTSSAVGNKKLELAKEFEASIIRPVHIKKLNFNNRLSSCSRTLVATTDIALANIEQIERNELVSKWIADGICDPSISEQNTSYPSSPVFENSLSDVEILEEKEFRTVLKDPEKSPMIKCHSRRKTEFQRRERSAQGLQESPKIGKSREVSKDRQKKFGTWDKRKLEDTQSSCSISEQNTSYPCSPVCRNSFPDVEILEEKEFPTVSKDLQKSPMIKCRSRPKVDSQRSNRSSRGLENGQKKFGPWDKRKLEETQSSCSISEQNTSYLCSSVFGNSLPEVEILEEKEFPTVLKDLEKSPMIKCHRRSKTESQRCERSAQRPEKSLKIGKSREVSKDRQERFGPWDEQKLNDTQSSCLSDKSPVFEGRGNSSKKHRPRIKRKRLEDRQDFYAEASTSSLGKEIQSIQSVSRFPDEKTNRLAVDKLKVVGAATEVKEEIALVSQDIFDDEIITASPKYGKISPCQIKTEDDLFCSYEQVNETLKREDDKKKVELIVPEPLWTFEGYCPTPVSESGIKVERNSLERVKDEENSFEIVIQDTEEFLLPKVQERSFRNNDKSEFLVLDSEFGAEKRNFVTDTERIDCDTSSENEGDNPALNQEKIITRVESDSDSDKTVSDIIEEPTTQDSVVPVKPSAVIASQYRLVSSCSGKSLLAASSKISEIISPEDPVSQQISVTNISVETTPPRTPESFAPPPEVLDSGKKKKSRPKKGSLSARLQSLISSQVSAVRLWRHHMSRESVLERSSAPCATLLVIDVWVEYGKNMHYSEVVDDPYGLLNDCFNASAHFEDKEKKLSRNLVVMTNPEFVGSVKLLPETAFNIYPPWQIYNRNPMRGKLILDALYFRVVSHPGKVKLESNVDESEVAKHSNNYITESEITREYKCPCLLSGKIEDSCLTKFTHSKIDIIDELIK